MPYISVVSKIGILLSESKGHFEANNLFEERVKELDGSAFIYLHFMIQLLHFSIFGIKY